jgi:hypothetical protein
MLTGRYVVIALYFRPVDKYGSVHVIGTDRP